jgi:hypothetical protein
MEFTSINKTTQVVYSENTGTYTRGPILSKHVVTVNQISLLFGIH